MRVIQCPVCKGKGGTKMKGPCFACDYADHPEGDSCGWRQCRKCKGQKRVVEYKVILTKTRPLTDG